MKHTDDLTLFLADDLIHLVSQNHAAGQKGDGVQRSLHVLAGHVI